MALPENVDFYTVKEVADHLRMSTMSVYRYVDSGKLRGVRLGGSVRIPADALDALAEVTVQSQD